MNSNNSDKLTKNTYHTQFPTVLFQKENKFMKEKNEFQSRNVPILTKKSYQQVLLKTLHINDCFQQLIAMGADTN